MLTDRSRYVCNETLLCLTVQTPQIRNDEIHPHCTVESIARVGLVVQPSHIFFVFGAELYRGAYHRCPCGRRVYSPLRHSPFRTRGSCKVSENL